MSAQNWAASDCFSIFPWYVWVRDLVSLLVFCLFCDLFFYLLLGLEDYCNLSFDVLCPASDWLSVNCYLAMSYYEQAYHLPLTSPLCSLKKYFFIVSTIAFCTIQLCFNNIIKPSLQSHRGHRAHSLHGTALLFQVNIAFRSIFKLRA